MKMGGLLHEKTSRCLSGGRRPTLTTASRFIPSLFSFPLYRIVMLRSVRLRWQTERHLSSYFPILFWPAYFPEKIWSFTFYSFSS